MAFVREILNWIYLFRHDDGFSFDTKMYAAGLEDLQHFRQARIARHLTCNVTDRHTVLEYYFHIIPSSQLPHDGRNITAGHAEQSILPGHCSIQVRILIDVYISLVR